MSFATQLWNMYVQLGPRCPNCGSGGRTQCWYRNTWGAVMYRCNTCGEIAPDTEWRKHA